MSRSAKKNNRQLQARPLKDISPSPENDCLYGVVRQDNDLVDLANSILRDGLLEPIVITKDCYIVSGHRRYAAAKLANCDTVPTIQIDVYRDQVTELEYKRLLRKYNHQRHKSAAQRFNEKLVDMDPDIAYRQLVEGREERSRDAPPEMQIRGVKVRKAISEAKIPMLNGAVAIIESMRQYWPLSVRTVFYRLLNDPPLRHASKPNSRFANNRACFGDLTDLLTRARLSGVVPFAAIADETRPVSNTRFYRDIADFTDLEMYQLFRGYRRDLMQSQPDHVELIVEKMTVQNFIQPVANKFCIPMTTGRGYCSLDPRRALVDRFRQSAKDRLILLIASDFDPDGEEIAESFGRSIRDDFGIPADRLCLHKVLLTHDQVREWQLPPNHMEAKKTSANYRKFARRYGDSVFELEAVEPEVMQSAVDDSIRGVIDLRLFNDEIETEKREAVQLRATKQVVIESVGEKTDMSDFSRGAES